MKEVKFAAWGGGACFAGRQVPCCVSFIDRVTRGQPFHFFPGQIHRLIFVALLAAGKTSHLTSAATNSCDASSQRGQLGRLFVSVKAAAAVDVAVAHSSVESATNKRRKQHTKKPLLSCGFKRVFFRLAVGFVETA